MNVQAGSPRSRFKRLLLGSNPRRTLRRSLVLAILTYLLFRYVLVPVRLRGLSMEPTFRNGSIHIANTLRYVRRDPQRGDVVVISMTGNHAFYLKRVLGLPGERIAFDAGQLYVNHEARPEPYVPDRGTWTMPQLTVGRNEYFVAGDNRLIPMELHTLGTVNRAKIRGGLLF